MCICSNEKNFICCKCIYSYGAFQISEGYKQKNCPKYFEICMDAFYIFEKRVSAKNCLKYFQTCIDAFLWLKNEILIWC